MPHSRCLSVLIFVFVGLFTLSLQAQDKPTAEEERTFQAIGQLVGEGNQLAIAGKFEEAMMLMDSAATLCERNIGKNNRVYPQVLVFQAQIFGEMGQADKGITKLKEAINILSIIPGKNQDLDAGIYNMLGVLLIRKEEYDQAILYQERALTIFLDLNKAGKFNYDEMISAIYNNIGSAYEMTENLDKALEYYEKALGGWKKIYGEEHTNIGLAYNNIGIIYRKLAQYDKALENSKKALAITIKSYGEEHPQVADIYLNLAPTSYLKGNYEEGLAFYQKAYQIRLKIFGEQHPQIVDFYNQIASMYGNKENYGDALSNYEKALNANSFQKNQFKNVLNLDYLITTLNEIGKIYTAKYYKEADIKALHQARLYFLMSAEAMDTLQNTFTESNAKQLLLQKNYTIYEDILEANFLLFQQTDSLQYLQDAFQYSSHAKSQLLYEALREADALHFTGIPDSLLQQEYNIRLDITSTEELKESLLNGAPSETTSELLAVNTTLFSLKQDYENLKNRFITNYPDYYKLKYNQSAISAKEVQQELLHPGQAMLEYFVGDSSIFVFVLRPDTFVMQEVKKDFPLEDWVKSLRENIYLNRTTGATAYAEAAYNLYQKLILPVKSLLPEQLIIIPDGILGYVPFEALLTAKPERAIRFNTHPYLLKEHQISYCYSATLLREMQQKKRLKEPTETLLAVAPFYTGDTTLLAGLFAYDETTRKDLAPLQNSGEEVYRINKLWKGDVLTGEAATEAAFTARAGNYRILHLATHGRADERVGDYSFLAFSEIKDSVENELLYVRDLYNLQLNADLVVLSACETGLGKLSRGEGIISLARAFAYAGAKSIVTTLWSVDDAKTKDLMVDFYRKLKKGMTKDAALRQAKLDYLESHTNPGDAHPFYWAGFAPIGDMRALR